MNRDQKAAVVDRLATELQEADAIFAVDYRGLSVKQAVELRSSLTDAGARFRVVKNTLTERAADQAGAEQLKTLLEGPTALTFVTGDVALAAKALSQFHRREGILEFKGGQMNGEVLSVEQIESIARLPAREMLHAQLVGTIAAPLTGLVRGLGSLISGLAIALKQVEEQGLVGEQKAESRKQEGEAEPETPAEPAAGEPTEGGDTAAEAEAAAQPEPSEAPGDPVAEAEAAEEETTETPSEGETTETEEG